jgi:hypothetical protein
MSLTRAGRRHKHPSSRVVTLAEPLQTRQINVRVVKTSRRSATGSAPEDEPDVGTRDDPGSNNSQEEDGQGCGGGRGCG